MGGEDVGVLTKKESTGFEGERDFALQLKIVRCLGGNGGFFIDVVG